MMRFLICRTTFLSEKVAKSLKISAVVIGRNEGVRLEKCLQSLQGKASPIVYVDSGSIDESITVARLAGAEIVELECDKAFTAARARNAGFARLKEIDPGGDLVQFLDGDCELRDGWLASASSFMSSSSDVAVVCGRRRERFPNASIWNRLIDLEWDTPPGEALSCGGDALVRREAIEGVGGYCSTLIAGEEPEMCLRMRMQGWRVMRVAAEMSWHDAAMKTVSQWWSRCQRAGHAFAEVSFLHRDKDFWVLETRRAFFWGLGLPSLATITGSLVSPLWYLLLLAYPIQVLRLRANGHVWAYALFTTLGKFPEAQGALSYWINRSVGRKRNLIEYKQL